MEALQNLDEDTEFQDETKWSGTKSSSSEQFLCNNDRQAASCWCDKGCRTKARERPIKSETRFLAQSGKFKKQDSALAQMRNAFHTRTNCGVLKI